MPTARGPSNSNWWAESKGAVVEEGAVISSHTVVDDLSIIKADAWVGSGVRIGHETVIGERAEVYYRAQIYDRVKIAPYAVVGGFVCNDAVIGRRARVFGSLIHRLVDAPKDADSPFPTQSEPAPIIEDEAVIGIGALIIGKVIVGRASYIAAGSVLTTDAEPGFLYVGAPAVKVKKAPRPVQE